MTVRVAINGFGRIGRLVLRAILESGRKDIEVVAINDLGPVETNAHLLRRDSVHGKFPHEVKVDGDTIDAGMGPMKVTADQGSVPASPQGARRRHRARMHRHLHLEGEGLRPPQGRRQARARLRPLRRRRPHRGLRRQRRQARRRAHRRLQRLVHHQLPGAGRPRAPQRRRRRARLHDDDPLLHRRPADPRHAAQGPLPGRAAPRSTSSRPPPAPPRPSAW